MDAKSLHKTSNQRGDRICLIISNIGVAYVICRNPLISTLQVESIKMNYSRLDPNLEEDRVRDAKILYVDFLMWQKSQDANLTEPPNDYG